MIRLILVAALFALGCGPTDVERFAISARATDGNQRMNAVVELTDRCCPSRFIASPAQPDACAHLRELLASDDRAVVEGFVSTQWSVACTDHVPSQLLVSGLTRLNDEDVTLRAGLISRLATYEPSTTIKAAWRQELERSPPDDDHVGYLLVDDVRSAVQQAWRTLAEPDFDTLIDASRSRSRWVRQMAIFALDLNLANMSIDQPDVLVALDRATTDEDAKVSWRAKEARERYLVIRDQSSYAAVTHLIERPDTDNILRLARRSVACGAYGDVQLIRFYLVPSRMRDLDVEEIARRGLLHRERYCPRS